MAAGVVAPEEAFSGLSDDIVVIGNGRIVAQGTKQELLASAGTLVRAADGGALAAALQGAGIVARPTSEGAVLAEAELSRVGQVAFAAGIPITELRAADGAGLEEMFLALTAESQRESTQHGATEGAAA